MSRRSRVPAAARAIRAAAVLSLLALCLAGPRPTLAAGPATRAFTLTDVTPRSFQIAWLAGEPAAPALRLFEAPGCANEIFTAEITPFPARGGDATLINAARQKGIMVVRASGLDPDREYCVQTVTTSLASGQATTAPVPPLRVRTEKRTSRSAAATPLDPHPRAFANDLAALLIARPDPAAPTAGTLVLVKVRGASSPLSAFVGDGIDDDGDPASPTGLALLDLNNLYSEATGDSLDLAGDGTEEMSARVLGGPQGFVAVQARIVPTETLLSALVQPAMCRDVARTACDGRLGDANADGSVADIDAAAVRDLIVGLVPILPCMVCADPAWDLTIDMKDALSISQSVTGLRTLP